MCILRDSAGQQHWCRPPGCLRCSLCPDQPHLARSVDSDLTSDSVNIRISITHVKQGGDEELEAALLREESPAPTLGYEASASGRRTPPYARAAPVATAVSLEAIRKRPVGEFADSDRPPAAKRTRLQPSTSPRAVFSDVSSSFQLTEAPLFMCCTQSCHSHTFQMPGGCNSICL